MLDALSERLQGTFRRLGSRGKITEEDLDAALREVRVALLEADVNFKVVRDFIAAVREKALGQEVHAVHHARRSRSSASSTSSSSRSSAASQEPLRAPRGGRPRSSSAASRAAARPRSSAASGCTSRTQGMRPLLVATDFERVAATEQLQVLGQQIGVPVYAEEKRGAQAPTSAKRALARRSASNANAIIIDTRGAVALDDDFADELAELADEVDPTEVLIVVDSMTGQEAVNIAQRVRRGRSRARASSSRRSTPTLAAARCSRCARSPASR